MCEEALQIRYLGHKNELKETTALRGGHLEVCIQI